MPDDGISNPVVVVRNGFCNFHTKTRIGQAAGARMVIIVDDVDKEEMGAFGTIYGKVKLACFDQKRGNILRPKALYSPTVLSLYTNYNLPPL